MTHSDPLYPQTFRYSSQAALKIWREMMHECLQIVHIREKCIQLLVKDILISREILICQDL